jgi:hypothetical protein
MLRALLRLGLCAAIVLAAVSTTKAQDKDYRDFFRKPETALEFWNALRFEIDVGRPDLGVRHLRGLLAKKPTEADLLAIIDKDGISGILRLRNIRTWSPDAKEQKQALADVEDLIRLSTEAQKKRLGDPARIRRFIGLLTATPEERAYAQRELYRAGSAAMPTLIDSFLKAKDANERLMLRETLAKMGPSSTAPLVAALACEDPLAKVDFLEILRKNHTRYSSQIVPFLWYYSAAPTETPAVRTKAKEVLAELLDVPASRLPLAKVALTQAAERYYRHEEKFGDPRAVPIWRWADNRVVMGWPPGTSTVSATQAEEYYGLRLAREALALDPGYRPAQVLMLSLGIDKAKERGGMSAALARSSPVVAALLSKSSPELVIEVLDRALRENRSAVVLATVRNLSDREEVRAKKTSGKGDSPLVRALYYPDPRVQFAAAEGLLRIPGPPAPHTRARIVEVLQRALTPLVTVAPGRKILVAVADEDWRTRVRLAVADAALEPIAVGSGREAMRTLRAAADIEAILLDSTLPLPGLASLLAQLRADADLARIPVLLAAVPQTRASHEAAARYQVLKRRLDVLREETAAYRATLRRIAQDETTARREYDKDIGGSRYTPEEKDKLFARFEETYTIRRKAAATGDPSAVTMMKEMPKIEAEMAALAKRFDLEAQVRESQLERFTRPYANVQVVPVSFLTDRRTLESTLLRVIGDGGVALPASEQKEAAEKAIRLLASLAVGRPAGYDVNPAAETILKVLQTGRLSPEGQISAALAASRLPGKDAQPTLADVILDGKRPVTVRVAATQALVENIQRHSIQLREAQFAPLRALSATAGLPAPLKEALDVLLGTLRPGDRSTGMQLREHKFTPPAVIPPPK